MPRTRRCYHSDCLLVKLKIIISLSLIFIKCFAEDNLLCSEGVCVPEYLCHSNGSIKWHGEGLIDPRFQHNECPFNMVCCKLGEAENNSLWPDEICNGKCVPASECETLQDSLDVRDSDNGCKGNNICCINVPESCDGVCIPPAECSDGIDLRLNIGNCPAGKACCRRPATVNNYACKGKCVFANQCSDFNPVRGMIDLRYSTGNCPANQICCNNVKLSSEKCDGLCLPRARCDDSAIDLRFDSNQCPNREICCQKPKTSVSIENSTLCKGTCLPAARCPNVEQIINSRVFEGCSDNEVCCDNLQLNGCDGTCTTLDQCAAIQNNTEQINLRLKSSVCPDQNICCKKLKSDENKCNGTCVFPSQCPELNSWKSVISVRTPENRCPFKYVCCKNPVFTGCDGKCVPQQQCNDDVLTLDLRASTENCPVNSVCCKNLKQTTQDPTATLCDGMCVDRFNCPDHGNTTGINLRLADQACPGEKVCCRTTQNENLCKGSCIEREKCEEKSVDLRIDELICPGRLICCRRPILATSVLSASKSCDGTCLPRNECSDTESINLRTFEGICPGSQICCKVPQRQLICDGTCAPLNQCLDSLQIINLRYADGSCPSNQICCKNIRTAQSNCKCVPANRCPKTALSLDPVDLRLAPATCPLGEVCCQDLDICDGSCVPTNECNVSSVSEIINLRYGKKLCPMNQVCCKKASKCDGKCVSKENCPSVDLRLITNVCPYNQVCCKNYGIPEPCKGICTQPKNCNDKPLILTGINLRSIDGSCPKNEICCNNPIDVCDGKCVSPNECPRNNIDLRLSNGKCPSYQVCCKTCRGTCVLPEFCADVGINLRNQKNQCSMNRVCCQQLKEPSKATCSGQCVLPILCPNFTPGKYPIDLRFIENGCASDQICCDVQTSILPPPSFMMDIPYAPNVPISSTTYPTTLNSDSSCAFSSDPSAEFVTKTDVPWLVSIWSRKEILGIQRHQYECVGTLIKSDLVLTSADCLQKPFGEKLYARVGDFNLKPLNTLSSRREISIAEITVHPDFNSKNGYANLAVLRLSKNATKNFSFCSPGNTEPSPAALCFLVGWNKQDLMNESILNAVPDKQPVSLTASAKCDEGYICSDEHQLKSQCDDAFQGSPVICFISSNRNFVQMGLAAGNSRRCSTLEVPNSFVSIASHQMWIEEQITPSFLQIQGVTDPLRTYLPPIT